MTQHTTRQADEAAPLGVLADQLIAEASRDDHGRASTTVITGSVMRATVIALAEGSDLAEHDSPPGATVQVLRGRIVLRAGEKERPLEAGELVQVPAQRHSVHADIDAVFLLTVALHG